MSPRAARLDAYGHPLPELADARQEVLKDKPHNAAQRRFVHALLEVQYAALLRRGVYAEVTIQFKVQDGVIQGSVAVSPTQYWRLPVEE